MRTRTASSIHDTAIEWLWDRRVPIGRVTVVEGDPGCGKSGMTMLLAAIVTNGGSWPDGGQAPKGTVVIANIEDPAASVIKPRLAVAGANLDFVEIVDLDTPGIDPLMIPTNVPELGRKIEEFNARTGQPPVKLLIVDPLDAFASDQIDLNRSQHARKALRSLEIVASHYGLAVLVIRHLSKSRGRTANYRGLGSISIIGASRSAITVARDPSNPNRSVLASVKGNWAAAPPAWAFKIGPAEYINQFGEIIKTSRVLWDGIAYISADELAGDDGMPLKAGELEAAVSLLQVELADQGLPNKALRQLATDGGISGDALWKASRVVGVMRRKRDDGEWIWELRGTEDVDFS